MKSVQPGDLAPDFTTTTHAGEQLRLTDFRGKQAVVLYFYPKDGTTICTQQACSFRDAYESFVEAGAVVIGVSGDSLEQHRAFADERQLPFLLVSDSDGRLRKTFGVPRTLGFLPGRVTYVIDKDGIVRDVFNSQLMAERHIRRALEVVRGLNV
jgi:peroxiredoxin Q/BCP